MNLADETVWLTQKQLSDLFGKNVRTVSEHIKNITVKINDNGLVALALLIAESDPAQMDLLVRLIVNLLID